MILLNRMCLGKGHGRAVTWMVLFAGLGRAFGMVMGIAGEKRAREKTLYSWGARDYRGTWSGCAGGKI